MSLRAPQTDVGLLVHFVNGVDSQVRPTGRPEPHSSNSASPPPPDFETDSETDFDSEETRPRSLNRPQFVYMVAFSEDNIEQRIHMLWSISIVTDPARKVTSHLNRRRRPRIA
jgi:hypothetical protein